MYRYININKDGIIIGESFLKGEVNKENLILVDESFNKTNKKYDFNTKTFVEYIEELPIFVKKETQMDRVENKLDTLLNDYENKILDNFVLELMEEGKL